VRVEPSSLRIELMLNKRCQKTLQIHNVSQKLLAYKVKTTSTERYCVGNNHGIIKPGGVGEVKILVEAMTSLPETDAKDKFLVMHMPVDQPPADLAQLWKEMERKNKERKGYYYHSQKIRCRLSLPVSHKNPMQDENLKLAENFSTNTNPPAYEQGKGKGYEEIATRDTATRQDARMIENELQQKRDDYEELMTYTVKLSNENHELKKKLAQLQSGDGSRDKTIAEQQAKIEMLEKEMDALRRSAKSSESHSGSGTGQATATPHGSISMQYWQFALLVVGIAIVVRYAY